jgi:hypothetical protein
MRGRNIKIKIHTVLHSVVELLALRHVLEVLVSVLGLEARCPSLKFFVIFAVPPDKRRKRSVNDTITFHFIIYKLFTRL